MFFEQILIKENFFLTYTRHFSLILFSPFNTARKPRTQHPFATLESSKLTRGVATVVHAWARALRFQLFSVAWKLLVLVGVTARRRCDRIDERRLLRWDAFV